jgi:TM2 domain-containing membrane protein YozV
METSSISPKSRLAALLLCFFLGVLGVHRFYVGKIGTGILMVLTFGGFGIWALIDLILIVAGAFKDKEGRRVFRWTEPGSV